MERNYFDTTDYYILPNKYHFDHEYCLYLHDQLAKIIMEGEKGGFFGQNLNTSEKIPELKEEALFDWLKNKFPKETKKFIIKNVFAGALSDALQFILTALQCSVKGKLSVSYALLRKPLKDNLFILELLNADEEDFLARFKKPSKLLNIQNFSDVDKKQVIEENCKKIKFSANFDDIIYKLRYDKSENGLEPLFQKANHIITSMKNFQTEQENLNFVFSNMESLESQWKRLYQIIPFLLRYFVDTAYFILNKKLDIELKDELNFADIVYYQKHSPEFIENMTINIVCGKCKKGNQATKEVLKFCEEQRHYQCPFCKHEESIFDSEITKD